MEATNMNYRNTLVQMNEPPKRTIVDMSGELTLIIQRLVEETNDLTMKLVGTRCDMPNGGEGPLPERLAWGIETLQRLREIIGNTRGFLG